MAALQDQAGDRHDAEDALASRQLRVFLDAIDRHFRGPAEHREHRPVLQEIDGIVAPFAGGHLATIEPEDALELSPAEGDLVAGSEERKGFAPARLAGFGFARPESHGRLLSMI